jgi:hypothetical protein
MNIMYSTAFSVAMDFLHVLYFNLLIFLVTSGLGLLLCCSLFYIKCNFECTEVNSFNVLSVFTYFVLCITV